MATGSIKNPGKKILTESVTIPVTQGNDYCYVDAKTGYNLIDAIFAKTWANAGDSITSIAWSGYNYILFLRGAATASETRSAILTWCEN